MISGSVSEFILAAMRAALPASAFAISSSISSSRVLWRVNGDWRSFFSRVTFPSPVSWRKTLWTSSPISFELVMSPKSV